jgi:hypothetical protein
VCFGVIGATSLIGGVLCLCGVPYVFECEAALLLLITVFMLILLYRAEPNPAYRKTYIFSLVIFIISFAIAGTIIVLMTKPVTAEIQGDNLVISGVYGTSVAKSDIASVETVSPATVAVGEKMNGANGFGILRGWFNTNYGKTLMFVKTEVSPWILIKRTAAEPILLSLQTSDATTDLYNKISAWQSNGQ